METIKLWALGLAAGAAVTAGLAWLKAKLPDMLAGYVDARIDDALAAGDDIDDELVLALCHWAERKAEREFPAGTAGAQKYALVADRLISFLPITLRPFVSPKSAALAAVIEANVERLQAELASHVNPPV